MSQVTPERFSELTGMKLTAVWSYLNGRAPVQWDPRDVRRFSRDQVLITLVTPNASGQGGRPRVVANENFRKPKSIHVSTGAGSMEIDALQDAGVGSMAEPAPENVDRNVPVSMIGSVSMPQGFQVAGREAHL